MKVTNWRRKLLASLVAGGMISPAAAMAANLDTNLVLNPGFESVDSGTTGDYDAPMILNWSGGPGFAYSHNPDVTGIPDYADGADPPSAGNWYFTANNNPGSPTGDWRAPDLVYQDIDVSTGATGTQIAVGEAAYKLSAWMSSYLNDNDFGIVHLNFRNASGTSLGATQISDSDPGPNNIWSLNAASGLVPVGTASVRVSLFGGVVNGGTDGYIDNVDLQLTAAANELVFLEVNTTNGLTRIRNQTGEPVHIDYYEITSATGALNATDWNSLQEQNLAGFPAGNGSGNGWEQFGGSSSTVVGESFLTGNSALANNANVGLGAAFNVGGAQNLVFRYGVVPDAGGGPPEGDYNGNGIVDAADYTVWRDSLGQSVAAGTGADGSGNGMVDTADYNLWKAEFGNTGGPSGPSTLMTGFVRYVTSGSAAAVPEPSSIVFVGIGLLVSAVTVWRK